MDRKIVKHSKEQTKRQAKRLTENDQEIMSQYESIIKNICKKSSNEYYDSLLKNNHNKTISQNKNKHQNGDIPALVKLGANIEQAKAITFFRKKYWNLSLFIGIYITNKR